MNKKVGIIGMGASGKAAAKLAQQKGYIVETFDTRANAPVLEGTTPFHGVDGTEQLAKQDLIVISPGVPLAHNMLTKHVKKISLFYRACFCRTIHRYTHAGDYGNKRKSSTTWYTATTS